MRMTVLFDLDDTLLGNDTDTFLRVYLKELSSHIPEIPMQQFIPELLSATQKMTENQNPESTLEETFDRFFYPAIGQKKLDLGPRINQFYEKVFPDFQYLTTRRPKAIKVVETALEKGYDVVIATNPLFPRTAILHRLSWAGMPVEQYPFRIVTTYEDFHFAKPNPSYYAEILARLGYPDQPAVMIGNSLEEDIRPAELLGLPTFWINGNQAEEVNFFRHPLSRSGTFVELSNWLDFLYDHTIVINEKRPEALLAILVSTPAVLDFYKRTLTGDSWYASPDQDSWSVLETICHLCDVELEIFSPRIQKILNEINPHLPDIDPSKWADLHNYRAQDPIKMLDLFISERMEWLSQLQNLPGSDWQRTGHHSDYGLVTLLSIVERIAMHDQDHLNQIHKILHSPVL